MPVPLFHGPVDKYAVQKSAAIPETFQAPWESQYCSLLSVLMHSHTHRRLQLHQGVPLVPVTVKARHGLCAGG